MTGTYEECKNYVEKQRKVEPHMRFRIDLVVYGRTEAEDVWVVHSEPW